jgi:hypothetical protein
MTYTSASVPALRSFAVCTLMLYRTIIPVQLAAQGLAITALRSSKNDRSTVASALREG